MCIIYNYIALLLFQRRKIFSFFIYFFSFFFLLPVNAGHNYMIRINVNSLHHQGKEMFHLEEGDIFRCLLSRKICTL